MNNNFFKKECFCANCGKDTHLYKNCPDPITSCGIILVNLQMELKNDTNLVKKLNDTDNFNIFDVSGIKFNDMEDLKIFCEYKNSIKFLMVRRKHTLGFTEFVRGHYKIDDIN